MENPRITFRPLKQQEHSLALELWGAAFGIWPNYFQRYYESDPWYQEGDTLGAWENETHLVSAVHICRRPLRDDGKVLLCGGICNVGTIAEYRSRGLSRQLLAASVRHMEQTGISFSVLWTDLPAHYASLGWEQLYQPDCTLTLSGDGKEGRSEPLRLAESSPEIGSIYQMSPRPLQMERSPEYFMDWVSTRWRGSNQQLLLLPDKGYAVIEMVQDAAEASSATIIEYRAHDSAAEGEILFQALRQVASHTNTVRLKAMPQFNKISELEPARALLGPGDPDMMIRNISLTQDEYNRVRESYLTGRACFWQADHV